MNRSKGLRVLSCQVWTNQVEPSTVLRIGNSVDLSVLLIPPMELARIAELVEGHHVTVDIAAVFWLRDACKAWNYVLDPNPGRRVHGKVVLQVV